MARHQHAKNINTVATTIRTASQYEGSDSKTVVVSMTVPRATYDAMRCMCDEESAVAEAASFTNSEMTASTLASACGTSGTSGTSGTARLVYTDSNAGTARQETPAKASAMPLTDASDTHSALIGQAGALFSNFLLSI